MDSKRTKASAGTVTVLAEDNRLRLRWSVGGKRFNIATGLADTPINRRAAEAKARQIELDILAGHFDETLTRYKPAKLKTIVEDEGLSALVPHLPPGRTPTSSPQAR
jgi:hypothetical protein